MKHGHPIVDSGHIDCLLVLYEGGSQGILSIMQNLVRSLISDRINCVVIPVIERNLVSECSFDDDEA